MPRASKAGAAKKSKVKATMAKAVNAIKGKKKQAAPAAAPAKSAAKAGVKATPASKAPAKAAAPAKKAAPAKRAAPAAPAKKAATKAAVKPASKTPAKTAAAKTAAAKTAAKPAASATKAVKAVKKAPAAPKKTAAVTKKTKDQKQAPPAKAAATTKKTIQKAPPAPAAPSKEAPAKVAARTKKTAGPVLDKFLLEQQALLLAERREYEQQAAALKAEADSLAQEMEPGDIQFDEESGEGGTMNIDRERDLALSAQARAAVDEIDHALAKIEAGTYGDCERCGQPIPKARLKALPYARLCVGCKSGGLSRR